MNNILNLGVPVVLLTAGLFLLGLAFLHIMDRRLIENMPTSKCRSVALGPVEVSGHVAAPLPIKSLIAQIPCVLSRVRLEQYRRKGKSEGWVTVKKQEFKIPFFVEDGSGSIQVDPHDAQLDLVSDISYSSEGETSEWSPRAQDRAIENPSEIRSLTDLLRDYCTLRGIPLDAPTRFKETILCPGDPVYVIGTAMAQEKSGPGAMIIRSGFRCPLFISERGEQDVVSLLARRTRLRLVSGVALSIVALALMLGATAPNSAATAVPLTLSQAIRSWLPYMGQASLMAIPLLGVLALIMYFIVIYNGLVMLRNEVNRAWANTDVLLQQRFDLVPNLVEVCKGYMQHEKSVLLAVTSSRTNWAEARQSTQKLEAAAQSTVALQQVFSLAERYPTLHANETFINLQRTITELEAQIADRRELYNAAVAAYNMRIADIPDTWVAKSFSYLPRAYFAPDSTKVPVQSVS